MANGTFDNLSVSGEASLGNLRVGNLAAQGKFGPVAFATNCNAFAIQARWIQIVPQPIGQPPKEVAHPLSLGLQTDGGNVGIGTLDPKAKLDIRGDDSGDSDVLVKGRLASISTHGGGLYVDTDGKDPSNERFVGSDAGTGIGFFNNGWRFVVQRNGNVGIGCNNPAQALSVRGMIESVDQGFKFPDGSVQTTAILRGPKGDKGDKGDPGPQGSKGDSGWTPPDCILLAPSVQGAGQVRVLNPACSKTIAAIGDVDGYPNYGNIGVTDGTDTLRAQMYVDPTYGGCVLADNIAVGQSIVAESLSVSGAKYFCVPNPAKDGTDIVYACIEGPEVAAYVRGTASLSNGKGVIKLPDHFASVVDPNSITVMLTPLSPDSLGLAVVSKSVEEIIVRELGQGKGNYEFDWEIKAIRKGYEKYQAVRPSIEGPVRARLAGIKTQ